MTIERNTFGYRDPHKAMAIKALQDRAAKAQAAFQSAGSMDQIQGPWTGAASMMGVLSSGIGQNRADRREADARAQLAQLMAGVKPGEYDPQTMSQIGVYDPELMDALRKENLAVLDREDVQKQQTSERLGTQDFTAAQQEDRQKADVEAANALYGQQSKENDLNRQADMARLKYSEAAAAGRQDDQQAAAEDLARIQAQLDVQKKQGELAAENANALPAAEARRGVVEKLGVQPSESTTSYELGSGYPTHAAPTPSESVTPGQGELDKKFAPDVLEWDQAGGPNAVKAITQVGTALNILEQNKGNWLMPQGTGPLVGLAPEWVSRFTNQPGITARDAVRDTVQQTLRQVLGSQFTEKEGEALMNRAFDPGLREEENIRRVKLLMDQVAGIAKNKQAMVDYFKSHHGSLEGYTGQTVDVAKLQEMIDTDYGTKGGAGGGTTTTPPPDTGGAGGIEAPAFDPAVDSEGDTGTDDQGNTWKVIGGKWVIQKD